MTKTPHREAERLIPAAEWEPGSVDAVLRLAPFSETLRKYERLFRGPFGELDLAVQDALVLRRLQQVTHILRLNPAWRERMEAAGVRGAPGDWDEWQALPVTDKGAATELFTGDRPGLVVPLDRAGFEIVASGGTSSGVPSETVYSLRELHDTYRIAGKFMGEHVLRGWLPEPGPRWMITTLSDYQMWSSGTMVGGVLQHIPGINYIGAGPVTRDVYQHMMSYPGPKAIMGISAGIAHLAELGEGLGLEARESFRVAMYGSGLLTGRSQAALREVYPNVVVMSYFAATQAETIGLQRGPDTYLATVPGLHLVEIVDDEGRWVREGEEGELVVTRLHAHEAPVLRYRVGDRVIRRPDLDEPGLKTRQFEFAGRSGDVLHLGDTQYAARPVYHALSRRLREMGVADLDAAAHEVQFVNDRGGRTLHLLAAVDDAGGLAHRVEALGHAGVRQLFAAALIEGLSLFNRAEANPRGIEASGYQFRIRFVPRASREIHRTEVGKVPLLRDHTGEPSGTWEPTCQDVPFASKGGLHGAHPLASRGGLHGPGRGALGGVHPLLASKGGLHRAAGDAAGGPHHHTQAKPGMKTTTILCLVDVIGALSARSLHDNLYLMDDDPPRNAAREASAVLKTHVRAGDELVWTDLQMEFETDLCITGVWGLPYDVCVPVPVVLQGTDVVYWWGKVLRDFEGVLPYWLDFAVEGVPMRTPAPSHLACHATPEGD